VPPLVKAFAPSPGFPNVGSKQLLTGREEVERSAAAPISQSRDGGQQFLPQDAQLQFGVRWSPIMRQPEPLIKV
jgi:hypothetical protein